MAEKIINNNGTPMKGYKGGKKYRNVPKNGGQKLPDNVFYREYDVKPYIKGKKRGKKRLVIGDDGSIWYTKNHYDSFTRVK